MTPNPIKIAFDIGGVISKYPRQMQALMNACKASSEFEVFILTDMPRKTAEQMLKDNQIVFSEDKLLCAEWSKHGDMCKTVLMKEYGIDIMIDDRLDYLASDDGAELGLIVVPRPKKPYCANGWIVQQ